MSHDKDFVGYDEKDFAVIKSLDGVLFCRKCGSFVGNPQIHTEFHNEFTKLELDVREMRNNIWVRK